ncbi:UNVERIFIED_CONTAM: hypothetical protein FKN15_031426 [Acipenser sinensis]
MDPAALNIMMEAQARRHEETLAAVMERMNAMFLAANQRREPVAEPTVAPPKPKVVKMSLEDDPELTRGGKANSNAMCLRVVDACAAISPDTCTQVLLCCWPL